MYDLEGDDDGPDNKQRREWIEIYNSGDNIDLKDWKLYEAKTNHGIDSVPEGGDVFLSSNSYAVIVDKPEVFKEEHPNFSGVIFDSAFNLNNTGETLIIRNSDLVDVDSVNYSSDQGANGDGNSLQKINGIWKPAIPTPGEANSQDSQFTEEGSSEDSSDDPQDETSPPTTTTTTPTSTPTPTTTYKIEPQIFAQIIPPVDIPIAGADFLFEAKSYGLLKEPLLNAEYQWTFGDGSKAKGQKVLHNYQYPSDYLVVLEVISGKYSASNRLRVKVIPSEIIISSLKMSLNENFIELYNPSKNEINLSWWRLRSDNLYFTLPKNTILLPKAYLKLPFSVTKLLPRENSVVQLLYPNGMVAFNFVKEKIIEQKLIAPVIGNYEPLSTQNQKVSETKSESFIYTVEKPTEIEKSEGAPNNQTASIKDSINEEELNSVGVGPPQTEDTGKFKFPLNKWSLVLGGITLIAVAGVGYATKLDLENEKPF